MTVSTATPVITWSVTRRRSEMRSAVCGAEIMGVSDIGPRWLAAGNRPHQESGQSVDHNRHQEQGQTNLDESRKVNVSGGLAELIGEHAGHGISRREQRLRNL